MILDQNGAPQPPTEILKRLAQIHPNLTLRFMPTYTGEAYWALCFKWRDNDPRWERVRNEGYPESAASDYLISLPLDCPVDQAYGYAVNALRSAPREDIRALLDHATNYNKVISDSAGQEVIEQVIEEQAAPLARKHAIRSFGGVEKPKRRSKS